MEQLVEVLSPPVTALSLEQDSIQGTFGTRSGLGDLLELEGTVADALDGGQFTVRVDLGEAIVRARLSGRLHAEARPVKPGDQVRVRVTPVDSSHGVIGWLERGVDGGSEFGPKGQ